jgi:hypothetical protein
MFLWSKVRPVRGPDNLTAIYEPIVQTMWDPRSLTTLEASYGENFYFFYISSQTYRQLIMCFL